MPKSEFQVIFNADPSIAKDKEYSEKDIYDAIYAAIMDHRLPPGTKLTESSFSAFFNVSRTIIRNVLFRLSERYVVEIRPNRGAIVARPSIEETHDVFEARHVVERAIIRLVVKKCTKEDIKFLKKVIDKEEKALIEENYREALLLSGEFHMTLAKIANNAVLAQFLSDLISRSSLIIALYESHGSSPCAKPDHAALFQSLKDKDEEKAVTIMGEHLLRIEKRLNLKTIDKNINLSDIFS